MNLNAQQKSIVWQGKLRLQGGASKEMNLRLELIMEGPNCIGVLYTRATDKGLVFGCDYIVNGLYLNNYFDLRQIKVIRSASVNSSECEQFEKLSLQHSTKDSAMSLNGKWVWKSDELIPVNFIKLSDEISEMALDEITTYRKELFQMYEEKSIYLSPADRLSEVVYQTEVDSTDLVVDIAGTASGSQDSVQVFLNGELITQSHALTVGQLRLRIKAIAKGENELIVVNSSATSSKLFFSIGFTQNGKTKTSGGEATFARNAVIMLNRKE